MSRSNRVLVAPWLAFLLASVGGVASASQLLSNVNCTPIDLRTAKDGVPGAVAARSCRDDSPGVVETYFFEPRRVGEVCVSRRVLVMRDPASGARLQHPAPLDYMLPAGAQCETADSDTYVEAQGVSPTEFLPVYRKAVSLLDEKILGRDLFFCGKDAGDRAVVGTIVKVSDPDGRNAKFMAQVTAKCANGVSIGTMTFRGDILRLKLDRYQSFF